MIISDLNYLETVTENEIEGSGTADLLASLAFALDAQSESFANVSQAAAVSAQTGLKAIAYASSIRLIGLT